MTAVKDSRCFGPSTLLSEGFATILEHPEGYRPCFTNIFGPFEHPEPLKTSNFVKKSYQIFNFIEKTRALGFYRIFRDFLVRDVSVNSVNSYA